MGLGRSGLATARALMAGGAKVMAWDDAPDRRAAAEEAGIPLADLTTADLSGVRVAAWSPGIPHTSPKSHPVANRLRDAGVPLVCDIELLVRARTAAFYVGVTGTNGKSTTTSLIGHILRHAGQAPQVGGNLGAPALDLEPVSPFGTYVLELSSYQLELVPSLVCDVAVLLNVTPDHLDRHGGMEGYIAAKRRIFEGVMPPRRVCIGLDDTICRNMHAEMTRQDSRDLIPFAAGRAAPGGVCAKDGVLVDDIDGKAAKVLDLTGLPALAGEHNWQNAAAAYAACRARGVAPGVIAQALRTFPGLAHRHETVATVDGVLFVNDSKATNAEAAEKAILCHEDIYWIAGGQPKAGGIDRLEPHLDRIVHAYLIGEAAEAFGDFLEARDVPVSMCGTLDAAVDLAFQHALDDEEEAPVVLLSPACASFDQFKDFEARGDAFKALVAELAADAEAEIEDLEEDDADAYDDDDDEDQDEDTGEVRP
ncbi:UDP-N-acetylmuramoyl-L-alanine--D-glutamate ligase [Roseospira navarrensis]|uniref:UDP-N-acetylmuramoylalanine--D-glutamate ligase n=2 Tax=Roseospira navarrensis TaxID=140058 RepID=A0A7X1ZG24_9PROT|nr:UDP-N-acetylmuramoyl-L-alanine--D-glutamate ligase [Roseospira navarrensis]MQX36737.1 UDP-N-acetylmuramoyl-L-alanine--D-glutamate ligase [Roseospira navarrensis]